MSPIATAVLPPASPVAPMSKSRVAPLEAPSASPTSSPDWYAHLQEHGWARVPGVISRDKADGYADQMYAWVEDFGLGFKRNDPRTRRQENLHFFYKGGLTNGYGVAHEQWMWDARQEKGVVGVFERIWGTDELLVSFDGCNISIPLPARAASDPVFAPWPHVDQSPLETGLYCVQGLLNLAPNGPDDGGLAVLAGSAALYAELFDAFEDRRPQGGWNRHDRHDHSPEQVEWLLQKGCKWEKVCADPGDLLLWDSRTVHYGATPTSTSDRLAIYLCYKPASLLTPDVAARRSTAWEGKFNSTHDPISFRCLPREVPASHATYEISRTRPEQEPVLSQRGRQLAGLEPYER